MYNKRKAQKILFDLAVCVVCQLLIIALVAVTMGFEKSQSKRIIIFMGCGLGTLYIKWCWLELMEEY